MLPKSSRSTKKLIESIFKEGRLIPGGALNFKFIKNTLNKSTISFIVPKSLVKRAVKRNTLRRLGYNSLKTLTHFPTSIHGAFIFKDKNAKKETIAEEVKKILDKI